jgi:trk system potassium uptake protein
MSKSTSKSAPGRRRWDLPTGIRKKRFSELSSAEQFVFSFVGLIVAGSLGFKVLPGLYQGPSLSWIDALFTATSAICVTGLAVVDTEKYFTFWGQVYILLLIQLGGVGVLTFASLIISALGGRPSLRAEQAASGSQHQVANIPAKKMIFDILKFTLFCEGIGALVLFLLWSPTLGSKALWPAIFHSVSAFCNAGFSTNSQSLMPYVQSSATLMTIAALIVMGGIGFVVMEELAGYYRNDSKRLSRLSTHTKLVLWGTGFLIIFPVFWFTMFEWNRTLDGLSWGDKLANAVFMSITPRTAGFNAIDYGKASDSTNFLTILLMSIGGSPGSTAGGMKVTAFMLLVLLAWSRIRGKRGIIIFDRSIPDATVQQAVGLFVVLFALTVFGLLFLQIADDPLSQDNQIFVRAFEVVSAINTVGLSMGITPALSMPAKLIVITLMFVGRVGPLALSSAVDSRLSQREDFRLAQEDVIIG